MNTTHAERQDCSSTTVPVNEYSTVDPYSVAEYVRHIAVARNSVVVNHPKAK